MKWESKDLQEKRERDAECLVRTLNIIFIQVNHWFYSAFKHSVSVLLCISVADPGVVQTNMMREVPASLSCLAFFVLKRLCLLQSPESGISSIIDAALAPPVSTLLVVIS